MKGLILIAILVLPSTALAVDNPTKFEAYKQRMSARRAYALDVRRQYNASKGPHVYRTAVVLDVPVVTPYNFIEEGLVRQPLIPVRPVFGYRYDYVDPYDAAPYIPHAVGYAPVYASSRR